MPIRKKPIIAKFIYNHIDPIPGYPHMDYCKKANLPYISITSKGTKYWKINYDLSTIRKFARFDKIDFADHIKPIHKVYLKRNNLPDKFSLVGGGKYGTLVVLKSDAEALADLLFDLLIEIHNLDQEKFDENPEYIRNGRNAEGLRVEIDKGNLKEQ